MLRLRILLLCNWIYYLIVLIALLYFWIFTNIIKHETKYLDNTNEIEGIVENYFIDGDYLTMDIDAEESIKATYYIKNLEEKKYLTENIKFGIKIKLNGELSKPINNTIPNTFNYQKYLNYNYIYWIFKISKIEIVNTKTNLFYGIKNMVSKHLRKAPHTYGYLNTFILGERRDIEDSIYKDYQKNGVSHLFALSGTQLLLFVHFILIGLKKLKVSEGKRYIIAILFIILYSNLTGNPGSILRAATFFAFLELNKIFYTHIKPINILLFTCAFLIFLNPYIIYDIGFQYSFATSFGLVLASDFLSKGNYLIKLIKVSFVAIIFSIPISLTNFYEINILALFNNLLFVPLVGLVYPISLIIFIFPFLDSIFNLLVIIMEWLNSVLAKITFLTVIVPKMSLIMIILFYLFATLAITKNKMFCKLSLFLIIIVNKYKILFDNNAYVYFLDIGQGDSIVIRTPNNKEVLMIDTGGKLKQEKEEWQLRNSNYHISDNTLTFLKSIGISKIDKLILTHGDEDHLGETLNILEKFKVGEIIMNKGSFNKNEMAIKSVFSNIKDEIKSNYLEINQYIISTFNNENDDSIVFSAKIFNLKFLFTGDAGIKTEDSIMQKYKLDADIIKLGHHGSKTSSGESFLMSVSPKMAIISSGRNNRYNHPSSEVIEKLNNLKINYLDTQTSGTVTFKISKKAHTISTTPP